MENYQKIEKIGEGKPSTALSVKFRHTVAFARVN